MRHVLRLRAFLLPYKKQFLLALLSVILAGSFVMVSPLLVRFAINEGLADVLTHKATPSSAWMATGDSSCWVRYR